MPLFTVELNRIADAIVASDLTIRLHTQEPTDAAPTLGRTTVGGTGYENGVTLTAANISGASAGDVSNTAAIAFGTADEAVGTVIWCSAYRGAAAVGKWPLPSTVIADGDTFTIPIGALDLNGATT